MNKKGFTIVELVIVIAVIAILAAVLIPTFSNVIEKAHKSAALQAGKSKFEEVYALDYADGVIDGKDGATAIASGAGLPADCTYTTSNGEVTKFEYKDTKAKYTATYSGGEWTVTKTAS